jgi:hypothetical protein
MCFGGTFDCHLGGLGDELAVDGVDVRCPGSLFAFTVCSFLFTPLYIVANEFFFSLDEEPVQESVAPIMYVTLSKEHLPQVHDLLERTFWEGIDGKLLLPIYP